MEFINYYTHVSGSDSDSDYSEVRESAKDDDFIDDAKTENNSSDYYGQNNVTRSTSDTKNDAFLETDLAAFQNENKETKNYCLNSEDEKLDDFLGSKIIIQKFKAP